MELWVVILIVAAADLLALAGMLWIRRRSPGGGYFADTERATGALGVAGTLFAVLAGFVFLISFQSYNNARTRAADEAAATESLFHTAELFPSAVREDLQGNVACYARAVVDSEWPAMAHSDSSPLVDGWATRMELRFERVRPHGFGEGDAAQHWFGQTDALRQARAGRLSEASPLIPTTIWVLLIIGGLTVIGFVVLFADSKEGRIPQLAMILVVTTTVVASLLTVGFLDLPYGDHEGSIEPTAMRNTLTTLERTKAAVHPGPLPCDAGGRPVRG